MSFAIDIIIWTIMWFIKMVASANHIAKIWVCALKVFTMNFYYLLLLTDNAYGVTAIMDKIIRIYTFANTFFHMVNILLSSYHLIYTF